MSEPVAEHTVRRYDAELARMMGMITDMGGIVESQVELAANAVLDRDSNASARCVESDARVDALEREVETFTLHMLALRQPVADDLRRVIAALKTAGDLERIGDYAANMAKRSIVLNEHPVPFSMAGIANMMRMVQANLKAVIDAFPDMDADGAMEVWRSDQLVDDLYNAIFRELITYMMEDPRNITPCAHLLFIAKNLERVGDHATNIAETIYFTATGQPLIGTRPKSDVSAYTTVRSP